MRSYLDKRKPRPGPFVKAGLVDGVLVPVPALTGEKAIMSEIAHWCYIIVIEMASWCLFVGVPPCCAVHFLRKSDRVASAEFVRAFGSFRLIPCSC